ncbi:hypothetical protein AAKU55_005553, partial [Oxalobacteraceae bacterium GrIS 1.11]
MNLQLSQLLRDFLVAFAQLDANEVEHGQCLPEREQMFNSPVPLQALGDVLGTGTDAHVLHRRQYLAISFAGNDRAQNFLPGLAGDISREKFEEILPLLQSVRKRTKPTTVDLYEVFCAVLYL